MERNSIKSHYESVLAAYASGVVPGDNAEFFNMIETGQRQLLTSGLFLLFLHSSADD